MGEGHISKLCHWANEQGATYQRIPRSSTQTDAVVANTKTADTVLVAAQRANLFTPQDIPDLIHRVNIQAASYRESHKYLALKVIVTCKQ